MAVCGLFLHLDSSEGRKTLELKFLFRASAFHLTNLFLFSCHHIPTNSVAPFSAFEPTHNLQFLQPLWRRDMLETLAFKPFTVANFRYKLSW